MDKDAEYDFTDDQIAAALEMQKLHDGQLEGEFVKLYFLQGLNFDNKCFKSFLIVRGSNIYLFRHIFGNIFSFIVTKSTHSNLKILLLYN